jgi:hypothetical protein
VFDREPCWVMNEAIAKLSRLMHGQKVEIPQSATHSAVCIMENALFTSNIRAKKNQDNRESSKLFT